VDAARRHDRLGGLLREHQQVSVQRAEFLTPTHKRHGLNVQVIADPAGRLIWASPTLPGARHDIGAAREHGILDAINDAINTAGVRGAADIGHQGAGPAVAMPQRRRRLHPDTGRYLSLSRSQRHPEEREDPPQDPLQPQPGYDLVQAVQTLILAS
jgi:DDE superfamily endonuclease